MFRYSCSPAKLERAKARVKRLDQPFTARQLQDAMRANPHTVHGAIERMLLQGWLILEGQARGRTGKLVALYRYRPAPELPQSKRGDSSVANGRKPVPGTGVKRAANREIGLLLVRLRKQGWTTERTGGNHYKATRGGATVILPATPSDSRALSNAKAELRRKGATI